MKSNTPTGVRYCTVATGSSIMRGVAKEQRTVSFAPAAVAIRKLMPLLADANRKAPTLAEPATLVQMEF
jgi:hypothetical protein